MLSNPGKAIQVRLRVELLEIEPDKVILVPGQGKPRTPP